MTVIAPGATIGILGGGQLGRMLALAAAPLGYRVHVYCPDADSPAAQVAASATIAAYDDEPALAQFAHAVDIVTYEFENIPSESAAFLLRTVPVQPGLRALQVTQDRLTEKDFVRHAGLATTPYAAVDDGPTLDAAMARIGTPAILKTRRFGYDGKGQARIDAPEMAADAWRAIGGAPAILEAVVRFGMEISVVAARAASGAIASYVPVENRHAQHILDTTVAPASITAEQAAAAGRMAETILEGLSFVGVLGVELFVCDAGDLLVNEIAPRVHNSGHWTIDACPTSQFEQHIRAICGLPLGETARYADAEMQNLLGDAVDRWPDILAEPGAHLHLYGKTEARPGRKMGHVTRVRRYD